MSEWLNTWAGIPVYLTLGHRHKIRKMIASLHPKKCSNDKHRWCVVLAAKYSVLFCTPGAVCLLEKTR